MNAKTGAVELTEEATEELDSVLLAVKHPLRRRVLRSVVERGDDRSISPKQLADRIGLPLSNVSYHVRVLVDCGAVRLVDTQPVRGSLQHFYCATDLANHPLARAALAADGNGRPSSGAAGS